MSDNNTANTSGGIGILGVLGIVFIVLKLIGTITWSWWWVLSPFWIGPLIWILIVLFALIFATMFGR